LDIIKIYVVALADVYSPLSPAYNFKKFLFFSGENVYGLVLKIKL